MRLVNAKIRKFRRFKQASIDLDRDLLAIVGPNEAGKSSLLDVLLSVEDGDPYSASDRTRGETVANHDVMVELTYSLSNMAERVRALGGIGSPRWYIYKKTAEGKLTHHVKPQVRRDLAPRHELAAVLRKSLNNTLIRRKIEKHLVRSSQDDERTRSLFYYLGVLASDIKTDIQTLSDEIVSLASDLLEGVSDATQETSGRRRTALEALFNALRDFLKSEQAEHPKDVLLRELSKERPEFLIFSEEARALAGAYPIERINNPPQSLANLLDLADVDRKRLRRAVRDEDHGAIHGIQESANRRLQDLFEKFWSQSTIYPNLSIDQEMIRVLVSFSDTYSDIAERSDGLRAFVALCAFVALNVDDSRAILLVDEAETHLHYAAQADLVRVFEQQSLVEGIFYTTHSAGCLPSDLGTGIRVVIPSTDASGIDIGRSEISNSFWSDGAGFSTLLLAMGAGVIAFTLARRAVIAEGASETILLPRLLREAAETRDLTFQVAPGIANVSTDKAADLDLEAAKVAYLVDGDEGGRANRAKLIAGGIPRELIFSLPRGVTLEDCVDEKVFLKAVNEELRRSHGPDLQFHPSRLRKRERMVQLREWCEEEGIGVPKKVKIAEHIARTPSGESIVYAHRRDALLSLHEELEVAVK